MLAKCRKCGGLFEDINLHVVKKTTAADGIVTVTYKCE